MRTMVDVGKDFWWGLVHGVVLLYGVPTFLAWIL